MRILGNLGASPLPVRERSESRCERSRGSRGESSELHRAEVKLPPSRKPEQRETRGESARVSSARERARFAQADSAALRAARNGGAEDREARSQQ